MAGIARLDETAATENSNSKAGWNVTGTSREKRRSRTWRPGADVDVRPTSHIRSLTVAALNGRPM